MSEHPLFPVEFIWIFRDQPLNYSALSRHPELTLEIIRKLPGKSWDIYELSVHPGLWKAGLRLGSPTAWSANPAVTIEYVKSHPDVSWNMTLFSQNLSVTWATISRNPDMDWDYFAFSTGPNMTWMVAFRHPYLPWNYLHMLKHVALPDCPRCALKIFCAVDAVASTAGEIRAAISANPGVTWKLLHTWITEDIWIHWDIESLYSRLSLTDPGELGYAMKLVGTAAASTKEIMYGLSRNPTLTWDIILSFQAEAAMNGQELPWKYDVIGGLPGITWDIIAAHPELFNNYYWISKNPNITMSHIQSRPKAVWNYTLLSQSPNIMPEDTEKNPKIPWNYTMISARRELFLRT